MSKIYKSSNLSATSPLVWKFKRVPVKKRKSQEQFSDGTNESGEKEAKNEEQKKMDEIITEARAKAEQQANDIVEKAEREKEKIFKAAEEEGYQAGYEKGIKEGKEAIKQQEDKLLQEARQVLKSAQEEYNRILSDIEPQVCQLVMNVGEKIINDKLKNEKETIVEMVRNGLHKLADQNKVTVRAHPEDYAQLNQYLNTLNQEFKDVWLELVNDEKLPVGAPLVLGENGYIELGVGRQIEELRRTLRQVNGK